MAPRKTRRSQDTAVQSEHQPWPVVGPTPPTSSDSANMGRVLRKRRNSESTEVKTHEAATPSATKKQKHSATEQEGSFIPLASKSTTKVAARSQNAVSKAIATPSQALARRPAGHGPQLMHRPTTEMMLTFQHSMELVRISITAAISTIAWYRQIFGKAYKPLERYIDCDDPNLTYESFKQGGHVLRLGEGEKRISHRLLRPGVSRKADKVIEWLENGVKDTVEKGYLASAELNFHTLGEKATEKNIYETYAITVTYAEGTDEIQVGARASSGVIDAPAMNVQHAQAQLDNLIDSVYTMMKCNDRTSRSAPRPEKSQITLTLLLNERAPEDYLPKGFDRSKRRLTFRNHGQPADVLNIQTPFHSVSVYLPDDDQRLETSRPLFPRIEGRVIDQDEDSHEANDKSNDREARTLSPTLSHTLIGSDTISQNSDDDVQTQIDNMSVIGKMAARRLRDSDTQDTEIIIPGLRSSFQPFGPYASRNAPPANHRPNALASFSSSSIVAGKQDYTGSDVDLDASIVEILKVSCECQVCDQIADQMINCLKCDTRQHLFCYGYVLPAFPSHIRQCFSCRPPASPAATSWNKLCMARRAVYCLMSGPKSIHRIVDFITKEDEDIGAKKKFVNDLMHALEHLGAVREIRTPPSRPHTISYIIDGNEVDLQELLFNPNLDVEAMSDEYSRIRDLIVDVDEQQDNPNSQSTSAIDSLSSSNRRNPRRGLRTADQEKSQANGSTTSSLRSFSTSSSLDPLSAGHSQRTRKVSVVRAIEASPVRAQRNLINHKQA